tara:strand:- start:447 stop:1403 length:957 start_codon:yes stop_codon:yes gene_type:complete
MSEIRVSTIVNEANTDGPLLAGITSVTDATQSTSTTTGAFVVSGGVGIAKSLHVGGNVTVGGTLTYEDVTNQDVIGLATFRSGAQFGASGVGGTIRANGDTTLVGVVTATGGFSDTTLTNTRVVFTASGKLSDNTNLTYDSSNAKLTSTQFVGILTGGTASGATVGVGTTSTIIGVSEGATQNSFAGILKEKGSIQATNITSGTVDLARGNVQYFSSNGSGATTAAITYKGGNNVSGFMTTGDNISVSLISLPNNSEYINAVTIDGAAVTEEWSGGTPSTASGGASTVTITTINIFRKDQTGTPNSDYLVLCAATNYE